MIFQINYETTKYDKFFEHNEGMAPKIVLDSQMVYSFLVQHGWLSKYKRMKVKESCKHAKTAILLDYFRLLVLRELGGIYIDADVTFKPEIQYLQQDLFRKFGERNVMVRTGSLFFIKGVKNSAFMDYLIARYEKAHELDYDINMCKHIPLNDFKDELAIVEPTFTNKYFTHEQATTGVRR